METHSLAVGSWHTGTNRAPHCDMDCASACELCQGSYKYQHDTDKDLKYLHVFPRVVHEEEGGGEGEGGGNA